MGLMKIPDLHFAPPEGSQGLLRATDALLVVDMQRAYFPGGDFAVAGSAGVLPLVNTWLALFRQHGLPVYVSRGWYPQAQPMFIEQGDTGSACCVAGTAGAGFAPGLHLPSGTGIVSKGCSGDRASMSAFHGTDLPRRLRACRVRRLFVVGLTTEGSVLRTVLDALAMGLCVVVLEDATAARDLQRGDGARALAEMRARGALVTAWSDESALLPD